MLNHICVMGRLTRDPELRYTQSQTPVTSFTVAVDRDYAPEGQDRQTDFIDCVAWRSTAEFVNNYFRKGSMAVVSGRLQSRKWQDRDGNNRTSWEINVDNVYFGEKKSDSQARASDAYDNRAGYSGQSGSYGQQRSPYGAPSSGYTPPPRAGEYGGQTGPFTDLGDDDGELPF